MRALYRLLVDTFVLWGMKLWLENLVPAAPLHGEDSDDTTGVPEDAEEPLVPPAGQAPVPGPAPRDLVWWAWEGVSFSSELQGKLNPSWRI